MADHIAATFAVDGYDRRVENGPVVLYVAELIGETVHVRWVSENFERLLGHDSGACIANPDWWLNHIHPDDQAALLHRRAQLPL
ncbi:MAG: PAS domain-containing protein [Alphaproteobacteria bacterium]